MLWVGHYILLAVPSLGIASSANLPFEGFEHWIGSDQHASLDHALAPLRSTTTSSSLSPFGSSELDLVIGRDPAAIARTPAASLTHLSSSAEPPQGQAQVRASAASNDALERVIVPFSIPALSEEERLRELEALSARYRLWGKRKARKRLRVLPLKIIDMTPGQYREHYRAFLSPDFKPRYYWTPQDTTYLFTKPRKSKTGFQQLHGVLPIKNEYIWAVWRQEMYGQAKIWRLLGNMELSGHRLADSAMQQHMQMVPKPYSSPVRFLNDAAHLDPGQRPA